MCSYCLISTKISHICRCEYKYFFNKANVVGVGLGYKMKSGFYTCEKCIKVYVSRKVPNNELCANNIIPTCYKGIPTDVEQSDEFIAYSLTNHVRPVTGGYDVGVAESIGSGTMGCLVTDGNECYILSNNHLIAVNGQVPPGKPIVQPGFIWGGHAPKDTIANLSKYIPIEVITSTTTSENFVDCAIAIVNDRSQVSSKVTFLGNIRGITLPTLGQDVQKVGEASELTKGMIIAIGVTKYVRMFGERCLFKDQIITTKMGEPGDSGAILLDDNMYAIGLLMSGTSSEVSYNPINKVLTSLGVEIITRN